MTSSPVPSTSRRYRSLSVANHEIVAAAAVHDVVAGAGGVIAESVASHDIVAAAAMHDVVAGALASLKTPTPKASPIMKSSPLPPSMTSLPEPTAPYVGVRVADHQVVATAAVHDVVAGAGCDLCGNSVANHEIVAAPAVHDVIAGAERHDRSQ